MIKSAYLITGISEHNRDMINEVVPKISEILSGAGIEVLVSAKTKADFSLQNAKQISFEEENEKVDVVIAVGGDGTILRAVKRAVRYGKATVGINAGRLGFLAQLEVSEIDLLAGLSEGKYEIEERMLLEMQVGSSGKKAVAVNDVVLAREAVGHTVDIEVQRAGKFVYKYRTDGMIVATPTGSTAYSMSAGGPVCDPEAKLMIVTPVCPHSLFSQSVIFSDKEVITLKAAGGGRVAVVADGEPETVIEENDFVTIRESEKKACFIRLREKNFYETFNQKFSERR